MHEENYGSIKYNVVEELLIKMIQWPANYAPNGIKFLKPGE